jgi:hypothetical protein
MVLGFKDWIRKLLVTWELSRSFDKIYMRELWLLSLLEKGHNVELDEIIYDVLIVGEELY